MANIYRSALELVQDLARGGYNPREYAELLSEGQDDIGRKPAEGYREPHIDHYTRKKRMRDFLKVPADELAYQDMSMRDPKYRLMAAIGDYTGSSSGFYNTPFRARKRENIADSSDYEDPHTKKQVEANALSDYIGSNTMEKIRSLSKSFYPSPVDFVTWRGIQPSSRTLKEHFITASPEERKAIKDAVQYQNQIVGDTFDKNYKQYGSLDQWPSSAQWSYQNELDKLKDHGMKLYKATQEMPGIQDMPLYDDYGSEAFLSTSVDRGSARGFAEDDRGMFKILVPEGTPIRPVFPYSEHDTEMEVLLPPRSLYKRTGERTKQGDVPLLYTGRGRPDSDKYIGAALPVGLGLDAYGGYDESE